MIKKLLVFVAFIGVGFTAYSYRATILNHLSIITQPLQSAMSTAKTAWANIPEPYKGIANLGLVGGVPTGLMMFFAWAKMRWQKKAMATQMQATEQIGSLNTQMQAVEAERDAKISELEAQLKLAQDRSGLSEAQNLVSQKEREIQDLKLLYQGQIDALHEQIEREKLKVHETVVVK